MKFLAFFVLFVVAASKQIQLNPELTEPWENFKKVFGKVYNDSEEITRRGNFEKRVADIIQHNLRHDLGLHSYRMGINEYSDMDYEEFARSFNGYLTMDEPDHETNASAWVPVEYARLPRYVDWRERGYVTPVKKQEQCGSCWAFSATGSLEGQHKRKTGKLVSLSEQNLIDCSKPEGNFGCEGGWYEKAFDYIKKNRGIDTEASYSYTGQDGHCHFKRSHVGATVKGYVLLPRGDEYALKQAVATIGPISVSIDADHKSWENYKGGIYDEPDCSSVEHSHSVLVVGYGTEDGKDYWLVKNSYGPTWGDHGYIKMLRNKNNQCGIARHAMYPVV